MNKSANKVDKIRLLGTALKILENNKNIQSIISVNTNILLRRFRLKFLRIVYSTYLVLQGTPQLRKHPV
jgi:hypothetical protein